jgi:hypothetical protein
VACILARVGEALDQPYPDGVADADEDDGDRLRLAHRRHRRIRAARDQELGAALHQITHRLKRVWIAADPHYIEHDVSILDHAGFQQPLPEGVDERLVVPAGR